MVDCSYLLNFFDESSSIRIENERTHQTKYIITDKSVESLVLSNHPGFKLIGKILGFKYNTGDFLGWHKDSSYNKTAQLTGGIVLNNGYTGGEFELVDGSFIDQTPGQVFTLSRNILHRIKKIKSGVRISIHYSLVKKDKTGLL